MTRRRFSTEERNGRDCRGTMWQLIMQTRSDPKRTMDTAVDTAVDTVVVASNHRHLRHLCRNCRSSSLRHRLDCQQEPCIDQLEGLARKMKIPTRLHLLLHLNNTVQHPHHPARILQPALWISAFVVCKRLRQTVGTCTYSFKIIQTLSDFIHLDFEFGDPTVHAPNVHSIDLLKCKQENHDICRRRRVHYDMRRTCR